MRDIPYSIVSLDIPLEARERIEKMMLTSFNPNTKDDLMYIEDQILQLCRQSKSEAEIREELKLALPVVRYLLEIRKRLLDMMFIIDEPTCKKMHAINTNLANLGRSVVDKMDRIYQQWLDTKDPGWDHDCQVVGRVHFDFKEEPPMDDSGSLYGDIYPILCQVYKGEIWAHEFSGSSKIYDSILEHLYKTVGDDLYSSEKSFPFGDWTCCKLFSNLYSNKYLAVQDILRIESFWGEAQLIHQNIVDSDLTA